MRIPTPSHPTNDLVLVVDADRVAILRHVDGETRLLVPLPPVTRLAPTLYRRVLGGLMRAAPPRRVLVAVCDDARLAGHADAVRQLARELQGSFGYGLVELPDLRRLVAVADTPDDGVEAGPTDDRPAAPEREVPRH